MCSGHEGRDRIRLEANEVWSKQKLSLKESQEQAIRNLSQSQLSTVTSKASGMGLSGQAGGSAHGHEVGKCHRRGLRAAAGTAVPFQLRFRQMPLKAFLSLLLLPFPNTSYRSGSWAAL